MEVLHPLDYAMEVELQGKEFYLKQASVTEDSAFREIFEGLAKDEEKHYQLLKQIRDSGVYDFKESRVTDRVETIFDAPVNSSSYIAIYQQALEFEEKAIDLFGELARKATSQQERDVFLMLEREEEGHKTLLWRILQLLQRPEEYYSNL